MNLVVIKKVDLAKPPLASCNILNLPPWPLLPNAQLQIWAPSRSAARCSNKKSTPAWSGFNARKCRQPSDSGSSRSARPRGHELKSLSVVPLAVDVLEVFEALVAAAMAGRLGGRDEGCKVTIIALCSSYLQSKTMSLPCRPRHTLGSGSYGSQLFIVLMIDLTPRLLRYGGIATSSLFA